MKNGETSKEGVFGRGIQWKAFFFAKKKLPLNYLEEERLGIQDCLDLPILTHPIPNACSTLI